MELKDNVHFHLQSTEQWPWKKLEDGRDAERMCVVKIFDFRNLEMSLILLDSPNEVQKLNG